VLVGFETANGAGALTSYNIAANIGNLLSQPYLKRNTIANMQLIPEVVRSNPCPRSILQFAVASLNVYNPTSTHTTAPT
jgi:hypothetical protein